MKVFLLFISLFVFQIFIPKKVHSQDFKAFVNDNYGGVSNMFYNPANIADSRFKFDLELMGASVRIDNNMYALDPNAIFNIRSLQDSNYMDKYMTYIDDGEIKHAYQSVELRLMSFMLNISKNSAIGISVRGREILNIDNLDPLAARLMTTSNKVEGNDLLDLHFQDMSQSVIAWMEYGLTYSQVFMNKKKHFLKAGITAKLLQGMGAFYMVQKDMSYSLDSLNIAYDVKADIKLGAASELSDIMNYQFTAKPGIGLDFGAVYEFRPKYKDYKYDMDNKKNIWKRDKNKYLLKVSFSVLDYGKMNFKKDLKTDDFIYTNDSIPLDNLLKVSSISALTDSLGLTGEPPAFFDYRLPTTFNLDIDYNIAGNIYINAGARMALNQGLNHYSKAHYISNASLGIRYESRYFGVSIPFYYSQYNSFDVGLGLRIGPLWIGSSNLLALTGLKESIITEDIYFALKLPIYYHAPKDSDGDLVSNKLDKCKYDKGTWETQGCPDSDGDGIVNIEDDCAYTAGLAKFNGCPDTDGDGIQDKLDECPDIAGSKLYGGCPDTDTDGIIDQNDSCIQIPGLAIYHGCPDTDNDSIPDNLDDCPETFGSLAQNGCPDTDGDGIIDALDLCPDVAGLDSLDGCPYTDTDGDSIQDKYDNCPKIAGPAENKGCPYTDSDNDGVADKDDNCPMTAGTIENNGCPVIEKREQEILKTAFNNLEFSSGRSIILASSYNALDDLASLMFKKPEFRLLIEGHTDNVGRTNANLSLSQNRAKAVKAYLKKKGVEANRIDTKWYGDSRPIGDNNTEEGRKKNRRVELKVIFD